MVVGNSKTLWFRTVPFPGSEQASARTKLPPSLRAIKANLLITCLLYRPPNEQDKIYLIILLAPLLQMFSVFFLFI